MSELTPSEIKKALKFARKRQYERNGSRAVNNFVSGTKKFVSGTKKVFGKPIDYFKKNSNDMTGFNKTMNKIKTSKYNPFEKQYTNNGYYGNMFGRAVHKIAKVRGITWKNPFRRKSSN